MGCACGKEAKRSVQAEKEAEAEAEAEREEEVAESHNVEEIQPTRTFESSNVFGDAFDDTMFSDENVNSCVVL